MENPVVDARGIAFEEVIRQLEDATRALAGTDAADLAALSRAMIQRADAITRLARAAEDSSKGEIPTGAVERLGAALVEGEEALERVRLQRRSVGDELSWLTLVRQGLPAAEVQSRVDCKG